MARWMSRAISRSRLSVSRSATSSITSRFIDEEAADQPQRAIRPGEPRQRQAQHERDHGHLHDGDPVELLQEPEEGHHQADAVERAPRRRQARRERHEERAAAAPRADVPRLPLELGLVDPAREEAVGLRRLEREQALEVAPAQVARVRLEELPAGARRVTHARARRAPAASGRLVPSDDPELSAHALEHVERELQVLPACAWP